MADVDTKLSEALQEFEERKDTLHSLMGLLMVNWQESSRDLGSAKSLAMECFNGLQTKEVQLKLIQQSACQSLKGLECKRTDLEKGLKILDTKENLLKGVWEKIVTEKIHLEKMLEKINVVLDGKMQDIDTKEQHVQGLLEGLKEDHLKGMECEHFEEGILLEIREKGIDYREEVARNREKELDSIEKILEARRSEIDSKEYSVKAQARELNSREICVKAREIDLLLDEKILKRREDELDSLKKSLECLKTELQSKENDLKTMTDELSLEKKRLERKEIELAENSKTVEGLESKLSASREQLAQIEKDLGAKLNILSAVEDQLDSLKKKLESRETELELKDNELRMMNDELTLEKKFLERKGVELAENSKTLEGLEIKLSSNREQLAHVEKDLDAPLTILSAGEDELSSNKKLLEKRDKVLDSKEKTLIRIRTKQKSKEPNLQKEDYQKPFPLEVDLNSAVDSAHELDSGMNSPTSTMASITAFPEILSQYENQKRRDWNTFNQYLKNHQPQLSLSHCCGAHVLQFLRYLDQFGKTKVHTQMCPFFGHPNPTAPCPCPLRQAWGSLKALISRLRAAYEENGGKPETNPFVARAVQLYLRAVRDSQAKARGISYERKKRKCPQQELQLR